MSKLSGQDHFQSRSYYREGVIDIVASSQLAKVLEPYIEYMRPAGVRVWWTTLISITGEVDVSIIPDESQYSNYWFLWEDYYKIVSGASERSYILSKSKEGLLSGEINSIGRIEEERSYIIEEERVMFHTYSGKEFDDGTYAGNRTNDALDFIGSGVITQTSE